MVSPRLNKRKYWFHPDTIFRTYGAGGAGWIKIEQGRRGKLGKEVRDRGSGVGKSGRLK